MARKPAPDGAPAPHTFSAVELLGDRKVAYYADPARGSMLTLRWWPPGGTNWKRKTLGVRMRYDAAGVPDPALVARARAAALRKLLELSGELPAEAPAEVPAGPFQIDQAWAVISDEKTGKFRSDTPWRREIKRALDTAVTVWGAATPWAALQRDHWLTLIHDRLDDLVRRKKKATRRVVILVNALNSVAKHLRTTGRIPADAARPPEDWREQLVDSYRAVTKKHTGQELEPADPVRHRHTVEESRKILAAARDQGAPQYDPRFELLLAVGAELRLGQVRKARRSALDTSRWRLTTPGRGKKRGETIYLTAGQVAAVEAALAGFLAEQERAYQAGELEDYLLFPGGRMRGVKHPALKERAPRLGKGNRLESPVSREWIIRNFHWAETHAKVDPVKGRAAYGIRRIAVDEALAGDISPKGLQALGGWSNAKTPSEIYASAENDRGREEAREHRARMRGEVSKQAAQKANEGTVHTDRTHDDAPGVHDAEGGTAHERANDNAD